MPKRSYRRLREEDRHIVYRMRKAENGQIQIAHALGFTQSAISKELSRQLREAWVSPEASKREIILLAASAHS